MELSSKANPLLPSTCKNSMKDCKRGSSLPLTSFIVDGCEGPYIDYRSVPVTLIKKMMPALKSKRKGPRGGVSEPFPVKLYEMLVGVRQDGAENIVGWQSHGRCFLIHHAQTFVEEIMPIYFKQSKLTSFQRQLNLYGFQRVMTGCDRGGYYHPLFLRGRLDICTTMLRTRVKGEPGRMMCSDAHADAQLSFYDLPPCLLTIVGALVADTTHVSDEDGSGAEELDTDHPDNSNALLPEVFDSSKGADHVAYQPLLQAFTYESPVNIFPELMEQPELMPFLLRPDQMSSCSALSCALEGASATVVSPTPSLSYNFTNQEKTDLQFLLVPPPSNQQDSHYPQGVNYDEFKWLVPNPLMTIEDAGSHKTGFFEGQKFLFVDEENLLAYESAVIRK